MAKGKKNLTIAGALCMLLVVGGIMALFTDTDSATNTFTVGNVSIDLTEPGWNENTAADVVPQQTIAKDPKVTNDGVNDAYVFMKVTVPKENNVQLFDYTLNNGWTLLNSTTSGSNRNEYVYVYGGSTTSLPTVLAKNATTAALFNSVTVANVKSFNKTSYDIPVEAYAIQSTDLGSSVTSAAAVWQTLCNDL